VVVGVTLVPGPVIPSVVVGAAEGAAEEAAAELVIAPGRIEETSEETTDTKLDKSESAVSAVVVGALVDVVAAAESVITGSELVAAAIDGVITPRGPNVMALSADVVAAEPGVSTALSVVGVVVVG
jgi:hypothetical protein